jgi:protein-tyrosine-phosphatase
MNILFVCYAGTCRSPMAASIAQHALGAAHRVSASGLYLGSRVDRRAHVALREMSVPIKRLRRKPLRQLELQSFDLIVVLDESVHKRMKAAGTKRLRLWRIEDPFVNDMQTYRDTGAALQKRIARLRKELA